MFGRTRMDTFKVTKVGDTQLGGWSLQKIGDGTRFEDKSIVLTVDGEFFQFNNIEEMQVQHPDWGILFDPKM